MRIKGKARLTARLVRARRRRARRRLIHAERFVPVEFGRADGAIGEAPVKAARLTTASAAVESCPGASRDAPPRAIARPRTGLAPLPRSSPARAAPHPAARSLPRARWPQPARFELRRFPRSFRTPAAPLRSVEIDGWVRSARCCVKRPNGRRPSANRPASATPPKHAPEGIWYSCNIIFWEKRLQPLGTCGRACDAAHGRTRARQSSNPRH